MKSANVEKTAVNIGLSVKNMIVNLKHRVVMREVKKPKLLKEEGILLQKFYQEDVNNLEKLLGRKLPWKRFN